MITQDEKETFHLRGLIRLDDFLAADGVARGLDAVLRVFERQGVWRDGDWHLPRATGRVAGFKVVKEVKESQAIRDLVTTDLCAVVTALLDGRSASPMMSSPQVLFTSPNAAHWTVPHSIWHLDMPRLPDAGIPGIQLFTFLGAVEPGGGGTLVVAGSHRLLNTGKRIRSKDVKSRLKREPYFRDLMSRAVTDRERFMNEPGRVGDVEVQVVELHGQPGDVFLMDMRLLHTLAPNAARIPRIMITQRFVVDELHDQYIAENADGSEAA